MISCCKIKNSHEIHHFPLDSCEIHVKSTYDILRNLFQNIYENRFMYLQSTTLSMTVIGTILLPKFDSCHPPIIYRYAYLLFSVFF